MRAAVLFVVALFVAWRLRRWLNRRGKGAQPSVAAPVAMLPCSHCGVHIPRSEALIGTRGAYCSADHRTMAER